MIQFINRKPRAQLFSICRWDGRWWRRKVTWTCGIAGYGWFFGFIKHDPDEKEIIL